MSKREFDVAIGARVVSAEGRKIQVNMSNQYIYLLFIFIFCGKIDLTLVYQRMTLLLAILLSKVRHPLGRKTSNCEFFAVKPIFEGLVLFLLTLVGSNHF